MHIKASPELPVIQWKSYSR